VGMIDVGGL